MRKPNRSKNQEFVTGILITEPDWQLSPMEFDKLLEARIQLVRQELRMRANNEYWERKSTARKLKDWWDGLAINSGMWV